MKFADEAPPGFERVGHDSDRASVAKHGVPIVCVPARRPARFGFFAPSWALDLLADELRSGRSAREPAPWKLRVVERAARLAHPADREFAEEAMAVHALGGDASVFPWLDERA